MSTQNVQYVVNEKGERTSVIVSLDEYQELLEDLHDLAVIADRREEPTVPFDELKKKLQEDGLLGGSLETGGGARTAKAG